VHPDGTITVSEYDRDGYGAYQVQTGTIAELGFDRFINFGITPASSTGPVFPPYDGTVVHPAGGTGLYVIAGGAPIYLSSWAAVHGPKRIVNLSPSAWSLLQPRPLDGTVLAPSNGGLFVTAGGAPVALTRWSAIGGPRTAVTIDGWSLANAGLARTHLNTVPSDGTVLATGDHREFIVAGGAPLRVANPSIIPASRQLVVVDSWSIDHAGASGTHLLAVPANGTLLTSSDGGLYVIAGGAPLFVAARVTVGYTHHPVVVDPYVLSFAGASGTHINEVPANGTMVRAMTPAGTIAGTYLIAGGAPFKITDWSIYGGPQPATPVDEWAIANAGDPLSHLWSTPKVGTVVAGLPSSTFSVFNGPRPEITTATPVPVVVNDAAVAQYATASSVAVTSSASPAPALHPLTFTATVVPTSATGTVTMRGDRQCRRCRGP
jgi:hypothetical protein